MFAGTHLALEKNSFSAKLDALKTRLKNLVTKLARLPFHLYCRHLGLTIHPKLKVEGRWPVFSIKGKISNAGSIWFRCVQFVTEIDVEENGHLHIGHGSGINQGTTICCVKEITLGEHVYIADRVTIYDTNFHQMEPGSPVRVAPVKIGNNVWIGTGAILLAGTELGDHCVVSAGAVVSGKHPDRSVLVGNPARLSRKIECPDDWRRP
jgi:acetyltransferase-like isoleucine patch superfamily enzyme